MGCLVVAATMTFDMITELIYNMTIHIITYDMSVYVDNSVDFVDYLSFFKKKRQMDQKWCIIAKELMWTNNKSSTEPVNDNMMSGSKAPDFYAYGLLRATHSHNSTQYSQIVGLSSHWYAHIGAGPKVFHPLRSKLMWV